MNTVNIMVDDPHLGCPAPKLVALCLRQLDFQLNRGLEAEAEAAGALTEELFNFPEAGNACMTTSLRTSKCNLLTSLSQYGNTGIYFTTEAADWTSKKHHPHYRR